MPRLIYGYRLSRKVGKNLVEIHVDAETGLAYVVKSSNRLNGIRNESNRDDYREFETVFAAREKNINRYDEIASALFQNLLGKNHSALSKADETTDDERAMSLLIPFVPCTNDSPVLQQGMKHEDFIPQLARFTAANYCVEEDDANPENSGFNPYNLAFYKIDHNAALGSLTIPYNNARSLLKDTITSTEVTYADVFGLYPAEEKDANVSSQRAIQEQRGILPALKRGEEQFQVQADDIHTLADIKAIPGEYTPGYRPNLMAQDWMRTQFDACFGAGSYANLDEDPRFKAEKYRTLIKFILLPSSFFAAVLPRVLRDADEVARAYDYFLQKQISICNALVELDEFELVVALMRHHEFTEMTCEFSETVVDLGLDANPLLQDYRASVDEFKSDMAWNGLNVLATSIPVKLTHAPHCQFETTLRDFPQFVPPAMIPLKGLQEYELFLEKNRYQAVLTQQVLVYTRQIKLYLNRVPSILKQENSVELTRLLALNNAMITACDDVSKSYDRLLLIIRDMNALRFVKTVDVYGLQKLKLAFHDVLVRNSYRHELIDPAIYTRIEHRCQRSMKAIETKIEEYQKPQSFYARHRDVFKYFLYGFIVGLILSCAIFPPVGIALGFGLLLKIFIVIGGALVGGVSGATYQKLKPSPGVELGEWDHHHHHHGSQVGYHPVPTSGPVIAAKPSQIPTNNQVDTQNTTQQQPGTATLKL